ncbi:hypothetical protein IAR50_007026 [Cryptococcus sp. DSM 104548]
MSANNDTAPSRIEEEASRAAQVFVHTLNSNIGAYAGQRSAFPTSRSSTVVKSVAEFVKSAIEMEVNEGQHDEGWTEEDALQGVTIEVGDLGIGEGGTSVKAISTIKGSRWSAIGEPTVIELRIPRIEEEAFKVAQNFVQTLNSNLGAYGQSTGFPTSRSSTVVKSLAEYVRSAIQTEVDEVKHVEGWTEEDALQEVKIQAGGLAIDESGSVTVMSTTVQGSGWSAIGDPREIEFSFMLEQKPSTS